MAAQPHIVYLNWESTGHLNPSLPLVAALTARGCKVTYFVGAEVKHLVEAAGATWRPFRFARGDKTGLDMHLDEAGVAELVPEGTPEAAYQIISNSMPYVAREVLPGLLEDVQSLEPRPSAVVYDIFIAAAQVVAHVLDIPAIGFMPHPGPGVVGGLTPMSLELERAPWVDVPRRQIQERYGFDILKDNLLLEFYSPRLNIVTTIEELFSPASSDAQRARVGHCPFTCVGAVVDAKVKRSSNLFVDKAAAGGGPSPLHRSPSFASGALPAERLEAAAAEGRSVVFVSLGTVSTSPMFWNAKLGHNVTGNDEEPLDGARRLGDLTGREFCQMVWRASFEALGEDPSVLAVMVVGAQEDALEGLPPVPCNFVLRQSVPQIELLPKCHAMLSHGGANSMHEALRFGVPLAVVPLFGDQPINADTVARAGVGVSFRNPMRTLSAEALRSAFRAMLDGGAANSYRRAAAAMGKRMEAAGGAEAACDAVLAEIARPRGSAANKGGA